MDEAGSTGSWKLQRSEVNKLRMCDLSGIVEALRGHMDGEML